MSLKYSEFHFDREKLRVSSSSEVRRFKGEGSEAARKKFRKNRILSGGARVEIKLPRRDSNLNVVRGVIRPRNNSVKFRPNDFRTTASAASWACYQSEQRITYYKRQIHNRVGSELNTTGSYLSSQLVSVSPLTAASSCNTLLITIQPAAPRCASPILFARDNPPFAEDRNILRQPVVRILSR